MIGWRVGWVAGPAELMPDVRRAHLFNVVCPVGVTQPGAAAALRAGDVADAVAEWQRRRDAVLEQLDGFAVTRPAGGWSLLWDVRPLGLRGADAAARLARAGVAVTAMDGWGETVGEGFVRIVFANEPVERLRGLGRRVRAALT